MTTPTYRPDIDGLRAIAVLGVVFYHSGFDIVSGGYVGVDVFFVISGFLITMIIVRELAEDKFSIAGFYERRMRRILPASIVTVAVCLLFGYLVFETKDLGNLAHSAIANSFFLSNIYFYMQTGYFDAAAALKPLLHTWSLSLEEQYYVVTPLLLMLIAKYFRRRYLIIVVPLAVFSFVACVIGTYENQSLTFYMLTTRGWELLIGSILAIAAIPRIKNETAMHLLAWLGLLLILFSMFVFDDETAFPGAYAAVPTIGTAILIYTGRSSVTPVNRLLSLKPLVFVGLISYSLYLWHWPIIVFSNYLKGVALSDVQNVAMLLLIFAVSAASWRYVETPFRRKQLLPTRKGIFIASLGATAILILASFLARGDVVDLEWNHWRSCEKFDETLQENRILCVAGDATVEPTFLLWGDSHARALNSAAKASAQRVGAAGYVSSKPGCPPLRGMERFGRPGCAEYNEVVLSYVIENPAIETVFLAAHWTAYAQGNHYNEEQDRQIKLVDSLSDENQPEQNQLELIEIGFYRTIKALRDNGRTVFIVGPVPEVGHNVPSVNHIAQITNRDVNAMIAPTIDEFAKRSEKAFSILTKIETDLGVPVLRPSDKLCNESLCIVALEDGTALYHDEDHLSTAGAKYISEIFDSALAN
jgi:peptidoglycan/LPS O-acetylase OafA/YrhL